MQKSELKTIVGSVSEAESEILQLLWERQPQSAAEIMEGLSGNTSNHPSTVKTLTNRLVKKGVLSYVEKDRKFLYSPVISKADFYRVKARSFLDRFFGGELHPLVSMFSESGELSDREREELIRVINDMEKDDE